MRKIRGTSVGDWDAVAAAFAEVNVDGAAVGSDGTKAIEEKLGCHWRSAPTPRAGQTAKYH